MGCYAMMGAASGRDQGPSVYMTPGQTHLLPSHLGLPLCLCYLGAAGHGDPKFDAPPQAAQGRHDQVFPKTCGNLLPASPSPDA